jgi:hypothetical protein
MAVNTKSSKDRRPLTLRSLDELRAEVKRIAAAERAGRVRCAGNWTAGQVLGHLAFWVNTAFEWPKDFHVSILFKIIGPFMRRRMTETRMPSGVRSPGLNEGTLGIDLLSIDEGERRMLEAIDRLDRGTPPDRHMFLGKMTKEQWIKLNLRHAELHCSFVHVG